MNVLQTKNEKKTLIKYSSCALYAFFCEFYMYVAYEYKCMMTFGQKINHHKKLDKKKKNEETVNQIKFWYDGLNTNYFCPEQKKGKLWQQEKEY